ncbi:MAG TPA: ATP-dependent metallopeptidase FtsH/Yme1/Tma family protein, partial [Candidatus Limiplasma pullistercoris]|nr:ATP-dependent metallopeptidase FtsH/Yme1/Tma family protein [Candidatus Limiplasma pullistercoris]
MKVDDKSPKKPLIFYYLIAMVVLMLLNALVFPAMLATPVTEVGYNDFLTMIDKGQVKEVAMEEDQILFTATDENGQTAIYKTGVWPDEGLTERLYAS